MTAPAPARTAVRTDVAIMGGLLSVAAVGWWWTQRNTSMMSMTFAGFMLAWVAMMTAMMFPAVSPVVRLYARAAELDRVAPLPVFVAGYLVVWSAIGIPAFVAWDRLNDPLMMGRPWAGRLAGGVLVVAAGYQLTPLKSVCLRNCRSPLSLFMRLGGSLRSPARAFRAGAGHGLYCLGCCWALMAVLVAVGTMNLAWMIGIAALIFVEKNAAAGERIARYAAVAMAGLGIWLLAQPHLLTHIT